MIATVSNPVFTKVRRRYGSRKISLKGERRRIGATLCGALPAFRFLDSHDDQESHNDRRQAAQEHGSPAKMRATVKLSAAARKNPA